MLTNTDEAELCFGEYRLSRRESRVLRGDRAVALTPKALEVLYHLASRPDRLVTKEELLESVWHVSPESAIGGPLALVKDGDRIELDVQARRLHLHVSDDELARRREQWRPPEKKFDRGYGSLFAAECTQAHEGCDFKFLHPTGRPASEPDIY